MPLISIGQAAASALATYLGAALTDDIGVVDRWPEFGPRLFQATSPGEPDFRAVVSVLHVGRRERLSVVMGPRLGDVTPMPGGQVQITWQIGSYVQPLQIDVWAKTDDDRDDVVRQLDELLNAGSNAIPGAPRTDPVADGLALQLDPASGYVGIADYYLDEPENNEDPEAVIRSEYRASYFGEARGPFTRTVIVPAIKAAHLQSYLAAGTLPPASLLQTWTVKPPSVAAVSPASGFIGGGQTVTLTGTGFVPGAAVLFGSAASPSVTVVSATKITCVVPEAQQPGQVTLTVTNVGGAAGQLTVGYRYTRDTRMLAWLDPRVVELDASAKVAGAPNRSGGAAWQSLVAAERPSYQPLGIVTTPALLFSGGQRIAAGIPSSFAGGPSASPFTAVMVVNATANVPSVIVETAAPADAQSGMGGFWYSGTGSGGFSFFRSDATGTLDHALDGTAPAGPAVWTIVFDPVAGMIVRRQGVVVATLVPPFSSGNMGAQTELVVGGQTALEDQVLGPAFLQGFVGHVMVFGATLGSSDLAYYEGLARSLSGL